MLSASTRLSRTALALRAAPLLLVPVMLLASGFPGRFEVSTTYWALSCLAAVVFAVGWRWPVAASFASSALAVPMLAAEAWGLSGLVPYLAAVALADVAARSSRDRLVAAATAWWSAALLLGNWLDGHASIWTAANAVTVVAAVGLPVTLGLYLRAQSRLAATYRERAAEAEMRQAAIESAVRSEERAAMARELHDLVAHHVASIVLRIGVAEHVLASADPRVVTVLDDVHRTAADALADVRRLQDALREPASSEAVVVEPVAVWTEIDAAVARTRATGFTVVTRIDCEGTGLDAFARLTMLRVTQEALTNVMKHADPARPVELDVSRRAGGVAVRVTSACGPRPTPEAGGHGLIGMTERLKLIGGRFDARRIEHAWVVDAWLPASRTRDEAQ